MEVRSSRVTKSTTYSPRTWLGGIEAEEGDAQLTWRSVRATASAAKRRAGPDVAGRSRGRAVDVGEQGLCVTESGSIQPAVSRPFLLSGLLGASSEEKRGGWPFWARLPRIGGCSDSGQALQDVALDAVDVREPERSRPPARSRPASCQGEGTVETARSTRPALLGDLLQQSLPVRRSTMPASASPIPPPGRGPRRRWGPPGGRPGARLEEAVEGLVRRGTLATVTRPSPRWRRTSGGT